MRRSRARRRADIAAAAAAFLLATAAGPVQAERTAVEVQRAQAKLQATGAAVRKALAAAAGKDLEASDRSRLDATVFAYELSAVPKVESTRYADGYRTVVSDGWMRLVEQLTHAAVAEDTLSRHGCYAAYARVALATAQLNMQRSAAGTLPGVAMPDFMDFVATRQPPGAPCAGIPAPVLRQRAFTQAVEAGTEAALVWLLGRQVTLGMVPMTARCRQPAADRQGQELVLALLAQDPVAAHPALLAHAALSGRAGEAPPCMDARQRIRHFFHAQGMPCRDAVQDDLQDTAVSRNLCRRTLEAAGLLRR